MLIKVFNFISERKQDEIGFNFDFALANIVDQW